MTALLRRRFGAALVGILLVQLAWILLVPPFGGIDEHDHAVKAAAVAHGDFSPHHTPSKQGWGEFVTVPASLAGAGEPECSILIYVHSDNCVGFANPDGTVRLATSAARYNPAYYAVVGPVGRLLTGDAALYAMRTVTALLCALLITAAFLVTRSWSRTPWPPLAMLLTLTPTAVYSTTVVAPNGIEICGGLLLWTALVGLRREAARGLRPETLLLVASIASVPLLAVRTLGPLWWMLAVVGAVLAVGLPRAREVARLKEARIFAAVSILAGTYGFGWSLIARSNGFVNEHPSTGSPWPDMFAQWLLWFFQTVAAAPLRNEYAPIVVYAIALVAMGLIAALAVRAATPRLRLTLLYVVTLASAVGIGATAVAFARSGYAWQGRYFFPFAVGFFVVLGVALDQRPPKTRIDPRFVAGLLAAVVATTQIISQIAVRDRYVRSSLAIENGHWHVPSAGLLIVLTTLGVAFLVAAAVGGRARPAASVPVPAQELVTHDVH